MDIEKFLSIIPEIRGVRVFCFCNSLQKAMPIIKESKKREFELEIATTNEESFESLKKLQDNLISIRLVPLDKKRYNNHGHLFDTLFVNIEEEEIENLEDFFKKIYRMMKNAGVIVYPVKKEKREKRVKMLEDLNYVAINDIEMDQNFVVLTARKMHGWQKV